MNRNYINDEVVYTDTVFNEMYYELEYQNDIMKSSYEYNLYNILIAKGFIILDNTNINIGFNKDLNKEIVEKIKDDDITLYDKYINNELENDNKYKLSIDKELEILGIKQSDMDILLKYSDIIPIQSAFDTHLKIRCLLYDDDTLTNRLRDNEKTDYFIKFVRSNIMLIISYKRIMRKYLPNIDIYKFEYEYDDAFLDEPIDMEIEDFKYIKSIIRTTKYTTLPTNKKALVDLMTLYATIIFSKDMIKSKKVNKRINDKITSFYSRKFNEELFNKHLSLFKIFLDKTNTINNICKVINKRYYNNDNYINIDNINNIIKYYNAEICTIEPKPNIIKINISLKEKILTYQPLEFIDSIEEANIFKNLYNDIIKYTFINKRNILKEYVKM